MSCRYVLWKQHANRTSSHLLLREKERRERAINKDLFCSMTASFPSETNNLSYFPNKDPRPRIPAYLLHCKTHPQTPTFLKKQRGLDLVVIQCSSHLQFRTSIPSPVLFWIRTLLFRSLFRASTSTSPPCLSFR
jgi:hypothetical protein